MIKTDVIDQIAYELFHAEKDSNRKSESLLDMYPDLLDTEFAYDVQDRLLDIKCEEENTRIIGRKLDRQVRRNNN